MTSFVDPIAWEFRPAFPVRRLIDARGGLLAADERYTPPVVFGSMLNDVRQTFRGLDRVVVALNLAGYQVPGMVVATNAHGYEAYRAAYVQLYPLSGLALPIFLPWPDDTQLAVDATVYNFIALRVLAWRDLAYPAVRPVSLATVPGFQAFADPADPDASAADGWVVLSAADPLLTDRLAAREGEITAVQVAAATATAYRTTPSNPPGLVRMLDPTSWDVPRNRTAGLVALQALAESIMNWLREPGRLETFLSWDLDAGSACVTKLALAADKDGISTLLDAHTELQARRRLLQPFEADLPNVLAADWKTHWLLFLMQLHEYGLLNLLPFPAPAAPAIPVLDLTGFYTTKTREDPAVIASMQLSQVGSQLAGWWWGSQLDRSAITGTLDAAAFAAGRFEYALTRSDGPSGKLFLPGIPPGDYVGAFGVYVDWGGSADYTMARRDRSARASPEAIAAVFAPQFPGVPIDAYVVPLHWLTAQRVEALGDLLIGHVEKISPILDEDPVAEVIEMNSEVTAEADALDLASPVGSGYAEHPLLQRLRGELRLRLLKHDVAGAGADAWRQLSTIVSTWPNPTAGLRALLALSAAAPHHYTYDIAGTGTEFDIAAGGGVSGGSFSVVSNIEHTDCAGPDREPGWADTYRGTTFQVGISVGIEGGAELILAFKEGANDLTTPEEWFPDDFICTFMVDEFAVSSGGYPGAGGEYGQESEGFMFFRGRDGAPAGGTGGGWVVQGGIGAGAGLSAALTGIWGWYDRRDGGAPPPPPPDPPPPIPSAEIRGGSATVAYFDVGRATLRPEGQAEIAKLALAHRALLEDPGSYLVFEGDASRSDTDPRNRDLSRDRVYAVYAYLRSLLTAPQTTGLPACTGLAIPPSHVRVSAYGESRPAWAGLPDGLEGQEWRKATVALRGRAVVTLAAAVVM